MVVKEHWAGAQDGSELSTEVRTSSGELGQIASNMETDTVLKKEDITDMVSQIEAVKEEANTGVMERIKIGSNNICIRSDLAKKNMMFSQESCQAIIEMGNVELIELKKSRVQCPSCLHYVFEGTTVCSCGKHIRSNQELNQRIRKAFDVLEMHLIRNREVTSVYLNIGNSIITKQMMRCELLQGRKTEFFCEYLGSMKKRFGKKEIPRSHWLERCVCTISRPHRRD